MKKLFILFLFSVCSLLTYSQIQTINIGKVADDNTGDPLRTLAIKVNNNFSYHSGLVALKANLASPTFIGTVILPSTTTIAGNTVPGIVGDTMAARIAAARPLGDLSPQWPDTIPYIATKKDIENIVGSGGGTTGRIYTLKGITDVTQGIPEAGDSLIIHSNFVGKYVDFFRNKELQRQQPNNTQRNGYWFSSIEGKLVARPVFIPGEELEIWSTNTIIHEALVPEGGEGGGGEPPATPLLTNLRAYWSLDEVSGNIVYDALGVYNGTTNAYTNEVGILGRCEKFQALYSHRIDFGTTVGDVGTSDFTVAAWIYQPALLESWTGIVGNWGSYPWFYIQTTNEAILNGVINFTGTTYDIYTNDIVSAATWQHIAMVADRDGYLTLYLNGVAQTDVEDIHDFAAVSITNNNTFSVGSIGNSQPNSYFTGFIDEVYLGLRVLSAGEIQELMTKTYPFTP